LVDRLGLDDASAVAKSVDQSLVTDDGRRATIRCVGPKSTGMGEQLIELQRPSKLTITRAIDRPLTWWYSGELRQKDNAFLWPNGTELKLTRGIIRAVDAKGYLETKI